MEAVNVHQGSAASSVKMAVQKGFMGNSAIRNVTVQTTAAATGRTEPVCVTRGFMGASATSPVQSGRLDRAAQRSVDVYRRTASSVIANTAPVSVNLVTMETPAKKNVLLGLLEHPVLRSVPVPLGCPVIM